MTNDRLTQQKVAVYAPIVDAAFETLSRSCTIIDLRQRVGDFGDQPGDRALARSVRCVLTNGPLGLQGPQMDLFPSLELIACTGAGYEAVDLAAARERGIAVTNAPATNGDTVADHAVGLLLAVARGIPTVDAAVRRGEWVTARMVPRPTLTSARIGLVGLGRIGRAIAARCAAFGTTIAYTARSPHKDVGDWTYYPDVASLALASDHLIIACPGGPDTHHLVDAAVLRALGPGGTVINIGRGTVIDTDALIHALSEGVIYGAGLDVLEGEPDVPAALCRLDNVVITPHMAGRSPVGLQKQCQFFLDNLGRLVRGEPLQSRLV